MSVLRRILSDKALVAGIAIVVLLILAAAFAEALATFPGAVADVDPVHRLAAPNAVYLLGTDRMGADIYSRLLFGARLTILIAVVATAISVLIGVPMGRGYFLKATEYN